jgi:3-oxoacyl-[acyl-carrier-protein] synthase-1
MFDAMGALSSSKNDLPKSASRPFDKNRDGFVISGGAGIVILESEEHAKKRNAEILAELTGYFANSDGYDMVAPSGEGAKRCMQEALKILGKNVDYINTHGTSTPVGDIAELSAIKSVFGSNAPIISSTKSMTGHSLGATGAQEAIYSIMMMQDSFIAPSINIDNIVDEADGLHINQETLNKELNSVMSNSFGFGGTNASLIFSKF